MFARFQRGEFRMTMMSVRGPARDHGLLGGTGLPDVGMLAARCAAAARRVRAGQDLDDIDTASLGELRDLLARSAEALTYFGSAGARGTKPSGALASTVEATIRAVRLAPNESEDVERITAVLHDTENLIQSLLREPSPDRAAAVEILASSLATAVNRETGHPGEFTSSF
jgi:hypothetical protein